MKQTIETSSGFKCELDPAAMDDMELFDAICDIERGNVLSVSVAVGKVLGDNKKALYDHVRTDDGRVPTARVSEELAEIFQLLGKK